MAILLIQLMLLLDRCYACYATVARSFRRTEKSTDLLTKNTGTARPTKKNLHAPAVVDLAVAHLVRVVIPNQREGIAKVASAN